MSSSVSDSAIPQSIPGSNTPVSVARLHPRAVVYCVVGLAFTLLLFYGHSVEEVANWRGSATLHTIMETMATMLAALVGVMALVRYYSRKNSIILLIGVGFLGTATLDGFHAIVTSAYFKPMMPSELPHLIPWSWVASRLFLSVMMVLSWAIWVRESKIGVSGQNSERTVYLGTAAFTLFCFCFFVFFSLPRAYYPELFFHRPEEFVPGIFFLVALVGYFRKGEWKTDHFEHWIVLSLIIGLVSQVVFMSHSGVLFDYEFDMAHSLKKVSYICVLIGLLASMYVVFKKEEYVGNALRKAIVSAKEEIRSRKQIERKLLLREKELMRSNEELEKFAYIASHDLQEPLRKIQSFGDRLESKYADVLGDKGSDYLKRMRLAANRMSVLINDLLSFSRIDTQSGNYELVDLNEVLDGVLGDLEILIDESNSLVSYQDLPLLEAHSLQMRQLFQNLVGNAIKYRDKNRESRVSITSEIIPSSENDGDCCVISIEDNGIGFDQDYAERIFEIFQRLHGRNDYDGTGVGLAVVRKIAERHGGSVIATSVPGEGSIFKVVLKLKHTDPREIFDD